MYDLLFLGDFQWLLTVELVLAGLSPFKKVEQMTMMITEEFKPERGLYAPLNQCNLE